MELALDVLRVTEKLRRAIELRTKYTPTTVDHSQARRATWSATDLKFEFRSGQIHVFHAPAGGDRGEDVFAACTTVDEFYQDMAELFATRTDGSVGTFCFQRLRLLQTKFELYTMSHFDKELEEIMTNSHRDFYNVRKVDTHIHHSAAMNAKHLLRFIKKKLKSHSSDVIGKRGDQNLTLHDVFSELGIGWHDLSLDKLNVVADVTVFHRFDRFNEKYNPLNQPQLRTIFLKTDNDMGGRYMAEITRELLDDLEESKYQHTEWRLSIYGRKMDEWEKLSRWVLDNKLLSPNNRWMIQVPRLYSVYHKCGLILNFQDMLDNIFIPIFKATLDPEGHPKVAEFLSYVSGFDSVDDESKSGMPKDRTFSSRLRCPAEWNISDNPSYKYYNYFMKTNLGVLNRLRASLGLNQFQYRPHAGEAGELHHLDAAFLLADGISHGIMLRQCMPLQYLFYLAQVGIAMSPCSNNHLFLSYSKSPFQEFFKRGLNLSLSTDDPLMFHQTKEPLMEEYSLAKQFFRLSSTDLCELARNSVLQSGFPAEEKKQWLGSANPDFNEIARSNVPNQRLRFRRSCLNEEIHLLMDGGKMENAMDAYRKGIPILPEDHTGRAWPLGPIEVEMKRVEPSATIALPAAALLPKEHSPSKAWGSGTSHSTVHFQADLPIPYVAPEDSFCEAEVIKTSDASDRCETSPGAQNFSCCDAGTIGSEMQSLGQKRGEEQLSSTFESSFKARKIE